LALLLKILICFGISQIIGGPKEPGIGATSTIRSGDWKLIFYYKDRCFERFNIADDIGELNDLSGSHFNKVKELATKLGDYLRSVDAQRPAYKSNLQLVPWPDEVFKTNSKRMCLEVYKMW
jgi:hypothetical protein